MTEAGKAFLRAVRMGFHETAASDEHLARWWGTGCADGQRMLAAYAPGREHGLPADFPVATLASFDATLNTGNGNLVMADFISDVTVRPTHRRRGLMRELVTRDLADAAERGLAFATLTASEGAIYGRFGFGVATRRESIEVQTDSRFRLRERVAERVEFADPRTLEDVYRQVCDRFHAQQTGSHARPAFYWPMFTGEWDWEKSGPNNDLRAVLHYDAAGGVDGFAIFTHVDDEDVVKLHELVATNPEAELGLWQLLGDLDLVEKVKYPKSCAGAILPHALVDPRVVKVTGSTDAIWLRVLDAASALRQRGFDHEGELVLAVDDPLGFASGAYRIEAADGWVEVARTDAEPDAVIDIEGLGSIYFGLSSPLDLAAVGRVRGEQDAVRSFARLFQTDRLPQSLSLF